eukprot:SAG31_NODE_151_length_22216_cov_37.572139_3_plen_61_part_00
MHSECECCEELKMQANSNDIAQKEEIRNKTTQIDSRLLRALLEQGTKEQYVVPILLVALD